MQFRHIFSENDTIIMMNILSEFVINDISYCIDEVIEMNDEYINNSTIFYIEVTVCDDDDDDEQYTENQIAIQMNNDTELITELIDKIEATQDITLSIEEEDVSISAKCVHCDGEVIPSTTSLDSTEYININNDIENNDEQMIIVAAAVLLTLVMLICSIILGIFYKNKKRKNDFIHSTQQKKKQKKKKKK
eukprot:191724_1